MSDSQKNIDLNALRKTIVSWLESRLDQESFEWMRSKNDQLKEGGEDWLFFTAFSAVPRYTGKEPLQPSKKEQQQAETLRSGWKPGFWSVDELGRTLLVLSITGRNKENFLDALEKTFISSDMGEAVTLYKSLPLLPYPEALQERAAEGIRSNITLVFNAVALHNPYPAEYLSDTAWNQMVLKALFVESPLYPIQGIDRRANKKLARMLVDYAHERWAAGRSVSPELWRPVGPFVEGDIIEDLKKVINHPDEIQQQAAFLALSDSPSPEAQKLIDKHPGVKEAIEQNNITWNDIGRRASEYQKKSSS